MSEYTEILFYISEVVMVISYSATRMIVLRFIACIADIGYMVATLLIGLDEAGMMPTFLFFRDRFSNQFGTHFPNSAYENSA